MKVVRHQLIDPQAAYVRRVHRWNELWREWWPVVIGVPCVAFALWMTLP
jgi:hypothetical protein